MRADVVCVLDTGCLMRPPIGAHPDYARECCAFVVPATSAWAAIISACSLGRTVSTKIQPRSAMPGSSCLRAELAWRTCRPGRRSDYGRRWAYPA